MIFCLYLLLIHIVIWYPWLYVVESYNKYNYVIYFTYIIIFMQSNM